MQTRILIGTALLLTLGSAVAGSFLYGQGRTAAEPQVPVAAVAPAHTQSVTPEMIEMWKATAVASDYSAPRMPI